MSTWNFSTGFPNAIFLILFFRMRATGSSISTLNLWDEFNFDSKRASIKTLLHVQLL
jgi:hypothetical protein